VIVGRNGAASGLGEVDGLSLAEMRVRRSEPFVEPNLDAVHRSEVAFLRLGGSTEPRSRQDVRTMRFPGAFRGSNFVLYRFSPARLRVATMLGVQYVQSVNGIPHFLIPQIIGALIARHYFWPRYGKQDWRRYAMVLSVGFGVGMSLIGMFSAALAMIKKAVSSLAY